MEKMFYQIEFKYVMDGSYKQWTHKIYADNITEAVRGGAAVFVMYDVEQLGTIYNITVEQIPGKID